MSDVNMSNDKINNTAQSASHTDHAPLSERNLQQQTEALNHWISVMPHMAGRPWAHLSFSMHRWLVNRGDYVFWLLRRQDLRGVEEGWLLLI